MEKPVAIFFATDETYRPNGGSKACPPEVCLSCREGLSFGPGGVKACPRCGHELCWNEGKPTDLRTSHAEMLAILQAAVDGSAALSADWWIRARHAIKNAKEI